MSLSVEILNQSTQTIGKGCRFDLQASRSVEVQPLCFAVVPHDAFIQCWDDCSALLIPASSVFQDKGLLVGPKLVADGSVTTHVFNMTSERVRIKQGEVVSVIVAL